MLQIAMPVCAVSCRLDIDCDECEREARRDLACARAEDERRADRQRAVELGYSNPDDYWEDGRDDGDLETEEAAIDPTEEGEFSE